MLYEDNVNGDILTEEQMRERMYEYIDETDIIETMQIIGFKKIYREMCDEQKLSIFEETISRLLEDNYYFNKYEEE